MRGDERIQGGMFNCVSLKERMPEDHPLRAVRKLADTVLRTLSPVFGALERLLVEQIDCNLLWPAR